ncbi:MAG: polysaccharide deacetylase family protein [Bacteroidetes bacterium]|nr:polysaccharide deacetylase family protein [Bacteroidota bacterium]
MRPFHIITTVFTAGVILLLSVPFFEPSRFSLLLLLLALYLLILVYGVSQIGSQFFLRAFCRGSSGSGKVAISFDDGPHGERSEAILEILEKHGCRASFFLIGSRAEALPEIVEKMVKKGHLIGNHSYSHSIFFPFFRRSRIRREVEDTNRILKEAGTGAIRFFRPPFGVSNPNVAGGVKASGMEVAGWSIRSFDTRNEPATKVVRRIMKRVNGGDVILLHETSAHIPEILGQLLPAIEEAGLICVTLDQLIDEAQSLKETSRY